MAANLQDAAKQQAALRRNMDAVRLAQRAHNRHPSAETANRLQNARERLEWTLRRAQETGLR